MGVYSTNRTSLNFDEDSIVANESYIGPVGAYLAMIEGFQNEQTMFEAVLTNDFTEAVGLNEGTILESELMVVNEAAGGILSKIKELLVKLFEKVKGLIKTFLTKLTSVFIRDTKALVNKYRAEVTKKDLSKMKFKWSKSTGKDINFGTNALPEVDYASYNNLDANGMEKYNEDKFSDNQYLEECLGKTLGGGSIALSEYAKEAHEYMYEDEDEIEGLSSSMLSDIMSDLINGSESIKTANKLAKTASDAIKKKINNIEKARTQLSKFVPKTGTGSVKIGEDPEIGFANTGERSLVNVKLNTLYKEASTLQTVITKAIGCRLTEVKFGISQNRRVFVQAAAFNPKSVKEDAILIESVGDASDYEVDMIFDGYEV